MDNSIQAKQKEKTNKLTESPIMMFVILVFLLPSLACGGSSELDLASIELTSEVVKLTRIAAEIELIEMQSTAGVPVTSQNDASNLALETSSPVPQVIPTVDIGMVEPPLPTPQPTRDNILFFEDFSTTTRLRSHP